MATFKEISVKARIAAQKDKNASAPAAMPSAPSVERIARSTTSSSKSIDKRLDDIECALRKLELNLTLVDGEGEDFQEYSKLKTNLKKICRTDTTLDEFLTNMDNKRNSNRLKKLINWLSLICPLIISFNQSSLPKIISEKFTSQDIKIAETTFQKYAKKVGEVFSNFLSGVAGYKDEIDIAGAVLEVDIIPAIGNTALANTIRAPETIINSVYALSEPLRINAISKGKYYSSKLCISYNILITTFYLSMFMYILYNSKFRLRDDATHPNIAEMFKTMNATLFLKNSGGKKSKKTKKAAKKQLKSVR
jgi:hypothetical protein